MKLISFAYTTPALLAGRKSVTRRNWTDQYAKRFKPGDIVQAYNRSPRHHGDRVALIRIISVTYEPDADIPDDDYADGAREPTRFMDWGGEMKSLEHCLCWYWLRAHHWAGPDWWYQDLVDLKSRLQAAGLRCYIGTDGPYRVLFVAREQQQAAEQLVWGEAS